MNDKSKNFLKELEEVESRSEFHEVVIKYGGGICKVDCPGDVACCSKKCIELLTEWAEKELGGGKNNVKEIY
jgi:endonuclease III